MLVDETVPVRRRTSWRPIIEALASSWVSRNGRVDVAQL